MSEQEIMDSLLRRALAEDEPPTLSSTFDRRLAKRIRPRRLSPAGRLLLALYSLVALATSAWSMRSESIGWGLIVIAVALPLVIVATVQRRYIRLVS
jgi:hypothetical protein